MAEDSSSPADAECEKSEKSEKGSAEDSWTPAEAGQPVAEKLQLFNSAWPVRQSQSDQKTVLVPGHPLANFEWVDREINGLQHKNPECRSTRDWRHRWGGWYCLDCWPCTDPVMCVEMVEGVRLKLTTKPMFETSK